MRWRFPALSMFLACSMMLSVSTPVSCNETVGFASSESLISPTWAAHPRSRPEHLLPFASRDRGADAAVIERREAGRRERLQRLDFRHERGQQQGLDQAVVRAKRVARASSCGSARSSSRVRLCVLSSIGSSLRW